MVKPSSSAIDAGESFVYLEGGLYANMLGEQTWISSYYYHMLLIGETNSAQCVQHIVSGTLMLTVHSRSNIAGIL